MRKRLIFVILVLVTFTLFTPQTTNMGEKGDSIEIEDNKKNSIVDETLKFIHLIGQKESDGKYNTVSKRGYLGRYQFHPKTLKIIGMDVSRKKFLKSKKLQDSAMISYLSMNKRILKREIEKYSGRLIKGKPITESGILAAAHLAGPDRVKHYLRYGKDKSDGNGTRISYYLRKFSGYNLILETKK